MAEEMQTPTDVSASEASRQASIEWARVNGIELDFSFASTVDKDYSSHDQGKHASTNELQSILRQAIERHTGLTFSITANTEILSKNDNSRHKFSSAASNHTIVVLRFANENTRRNMNEWDSYGLKAETSFIDFKIGKHVRAIQEVLDSIAFPIQRAIDTLGCGAVVTNHTSVHVHVQVSGIPDMMLVLRELAFLLYIYEEEINRMHPPCRRPEHKSSSHTLESNRASLPEFIAEQKESQDFQKVTTVQEIRERVNRCAKSQDFLDLVGGESRVNSKLVSWRGLISGHQYPATVEFHQHRGTLNMEEVRWWVVFVIGLMRLAAIYACNQSCPITSWDSRISIFDLMIAMGMEQAGIDFYASRIASYMHFPEDGPLNVTDTRTEFALGNDCYARRPPLPSAPPSTFPSSTFPSSTSPSSTSPLVSSPSLSSLTPHDTNASDTQQGTKAAPVKTILGKRPADDPPYGEPTAQRVNTGIARAATSAIIQSYDQYLQTLLAANPSGYVDNNIANEPMFIIQDRQIAFAMNYREAQWQPLSTSSVGARTTYAATPTGNMCGIWAVLLSLKHQYPDYASGRNFRFHDVLRAVRYPIGSRGSPIQNKNNFTDEELAAGLQYLTNGEYRLIVCTNSRDHGNGHGRLVVPGGGSTDSLGFARNVYISQSPGRITSGHWRTMRRK